MRSSKYTISKGLIQLFPIIITSGIVYIIFQTNDATNINHRIYNTVLIIY